jgi:tetratricopeptide (TPR) repeat protein
MWLQRLFVALALLTPSLCWAPNLGAQEEEPEPVPEPVSEPVEPVVEDPPVVQPAPHPDPDADRGGHNPADREAAESLLKVGQGLFDLGQYREASSKLQQSLDAWPLAEAAWLLAQSHDKVGLIASAWAAYRQAARLLRKEGDPREAEASAHAAELEPKIPRLTLVASKVVPRLEIARGDTVFGDGVLGVALAVDPGTHHIEARARGYRAWSVDVVLAASEKKTITIPELEKLSADEVEPWVVDDHGVLWGVGLVTGSVGIVSLGIGALLGAMAAADVNEAESDDSLCGADRVCTPEGAELIDGADDKAIAATVLLAAGAGALVAGFVMVAADRPARPGSSESARLEVLVGAGHLGLRGHF